MPNPPVPAAAPGLPSPKPRRSRPAPAPAPAPAAKHLPAALRTKTPITADVLGHVLAGAFLALVLSAPRVNAPRSVLSNENWLNDLANRLSELGYAASETPAVAETLCTASRVLMQTEEA